MKRNRMIKSVLSIALTFSLTGIIPVRAEGEQAEETYIQEALNGKYDDISSDEASIRGFVVRLYRLVLLREPDDGGFRYWNDGITKQTITGVTAVKGFFLSAEMTKRNLSDEEFVKTLYRTVLNREADAGGLKNWKDRLSVLMTREYVITGFVNSAEFNALCKKYGVNQGSAGNTSAYRDRNYLITSFVCRMYTKVLGRAAETAGVEGWCKKIFAENATGADLAQGFFLSPEFAKKNVSNTDYVKTCYRAILDREGSNAEISGWSAKLNAGKTRKEVLAGFVNSAEFDNLCKKYGITRGTMVLGGWKTIDGKKYYIKENGQYAKKEILTINGKRYGFTATGRWIGEKTESYLDAYQKAINLVNQITNDSMTEDQKLRTCFGVFKNFTQKNPWIPHYNGEGWVEKYANDCFDRHIGNCMSYAACFGLMAQVLGVENVYCCNTWGHGWTEINNLIYDPEAALHSAQNFYGRSLDNKEGIGMDYKGAIDRRYTSNIYVKL